MILKVLELVGLLLTALVFGVFWGPWIGLTRSMSTLDKDVMLVVVHRMDRNLGRLMTVLFPVTLLVTVAELVLDFGDALAFSLTLAALVCLTITLAVTMLVEVPVVEKIRGWTSATIPDDWEHLRDRWVSFHPARVIPGFAALALLAAAAIFATS